MDVVKNDVIDLIEKELKAANEKFSLFRSDHEGYAVIKEEVEKAKNEMEGAEITLDELWKAIKDNRETISYISDLYFYALEGAVEMIQVAAMAKKFLHSKN